ncbi:MAG: hypothetical protein FJ144_12035 [Deltaproteobacteria bacterium]|nr:hypothetical protein [Deltaproteobacteria bacterium]
MSETSPTSPHPELLSDAASVPVGPCPSCEREVLGHAAESGGGFACVHCDGPLRHVDWIGESELSELGYDVWDPLAGGCATGCASGGCGAKRG